MRAEGFSIPEILIKDEICTYDEKFSTHSHDDDQEKEYKAFNLEYNIRQRCRCLSDSNLTLTKVFDEETGSVSDSSEVKFDKLKSAMRYNRKKILPRNPTSTQEVEAYLNHTLVQNLLTEDGLTLNHEFIVREEFAYLVFECKSILETLPDQRIFNITCTLRVVPVGFFEVLLTISIVKNNNVSDLFYKTAIELFCLYLVFRLSHVSLS